MLDTLCLDQSETLPDSGIYTYIFYTEGATGSSSVYHLELRSTILYCTATWSPLSYLLIVKAGNQPSFSLLVSGFVSLFFPKIDTIQGFCPKEGHSFKAKVVFLCPDSIQVPPPLARSL